MKDIVVAFYPELGKINSPSRFWLSIIRDCYGSYRINMQFHKGRCSVLHHASVRTGDLFKYFLPSPKASLYY